MHAAHGLAVLVILGAAIPAAAEQAGPCPYTPESGAYTSTELATTLGRSLAPEKPAECLFTESGQVGAAFYLGSPSDPIPHVRIFRSGEFGRQGVVGLAGKIPVRGVGGFRDLDSATLQQIRRAAGIPEPASPASRLQEDRNAERLREAMKAARRRVAAYNPMAVPPQAVTTRHRVMTRTYDRLDRLESETVQLEDGNTATISYTYWDNGLRKTMTDAVGRITFYEYDGQNRLQRLTANRGTPDERVSIYTYWPDSLLKTLTKPDGSVTFYDYDRADRLTGLVVRKDGAEILSYAYDYDDNGNRTIQIEVNGGAPESTIYTYDAQDRLKTITYPNDHVVVYRYDSVGNRIAETERDATGALLSDKVAVFDAFNRLVSVTDAVNPANNATFVHDRNGNLISKTTSSGTETFDYDVSNQMVESRKGEQISGRFAYDGFGRRYLKIGLDGVRQYLYDQTSLVEELNESNVEVAKYEWGNDHLVGLYRPADPPQYFHPDALGSVALLTAEDGTVVARYQYDAWGVITETFVVSPSPNHFGFTGYYFDAETQLYYAKARFYDPTVGRFTTADTFPPKLDDPPSLNLFLYANANPARYIDPSGHAIVESEDLSTNDLLSRLRQYSPDDRVVYRERPCGAGNVCINPQKPDNRLAAILRQSGGDRDKAYQLVLAMKAANQKRAAAITIEESDLTPAGELDKGRLFDQFIASIGTHAASIEGLRDEFDAAIAGAGVGESRDISFAYNVGHDYSSAIAQQLAHRDAEEHFGPDFIQRNAHLTGQWGAAPRDVSADAALSLGLDTLTAVSAGLGIYRATAGLFQGASVESRGLRELHVGPYEESTARGLGKVGDKLTGDHLPSFAAVRRNVERQLGRRLTPAEAESLRSKTTTITVPEDFHRAHSPTYGGRNTPAQIEADSLDLSAAARRDAQALIQAMVKRGKSPAEIQRALDRLHQMNREGGIY